jgi:hypothetical protein
MKDAIKKAIEKVFLIRQDFDENELSGKEAKEMIGDILTDLVEEARKESAWEMFRGLFNKRSKSNIYEELFGYRTTYEIIRDFTEKEAIEIMRQIEKELEGEDDKTRA